MRSKTRSKLQSEVQVTQGSAHVVSPTHVLRPGASSGSLFTSEVSKDRPCDEVGDELCQRPKGGKNLYSIRRSVRNISIRVDTHHLLTTRRYWCEPGKNSKKMAESTGKLLHVRRNLISDFAVFCQRRPSQLHSPTNTNTP